MFNKHTGRHYYRTSNPLQSILLTHTKTHTHTHTHTHTASHQYPAYTTNSVQWPHSMRLLRLLCHALRTNSTRIYIRGSSSRRRHAHPQGLRSPAAAAEEEPCCCCCCSAPFLGPFQHAQFAPHLQHLQHLQAHAAGSSERWD
jgi:hypothetical protein